MNYIRVTKNNHSRFEVVRFGDGTHGFQRNLDESRARSMAEAFSGGIVCPDLLAADVGGRLVIIDGQHRHAARNFRPFSLNAKVIPMTMQEAAHQFVVLNSAGKRVPLSLRLSVARDDASKAIRMISEACGVSLQFAYRAVLGASGKTWLPVGARIDKAAISTATFVCSVWFRNTDGDAPVARPLCRRAAVIQAICSIVRGKSRNATYSVIKQIMRRANFRKDGALASRYGTSATSQRFMKNYFMSIAWKN